jgi:hypothetical protein
MRPPSNLIPDSLRMRDPGLELPDRMAGRDQDPNAQVLRMFETCELPDAFEASSRATAILLGLLPGRVAVGLGIELRHEPLAGVDAQFGARDVLPFDNEAPARLTLDEVVGAVVRNREAPEPA